MYSTYLGGQASGEQVSDGRAIAVDSDGNAYVTGNTAGNFPLVNPFQSKFGNTFVAKLNQAGDALVFSTYFGLLDIGNSIAVDSNRNVYVAGSAGPGLPVVNAIQPTLGGTDGNAFVAKFNPQGSALVYCTYLGGSGFVDDARIAVDSAGSAYVAGIAAVGFPVVNAIQPTLRASGPNAFITKINPQGTALVYSTYWGGTDGEFVGGIAVDAIGNAYITGLTGAGFPVVNAYQPSLVGNAAAGDRNAFVAKINAQGSAIVYSTYLGGFGVSEGSAIAVDPVGNAYVTGYTGYGSADFPVLNALQPMLGGGVDAFVAAFNPQGALVYSTYLGGPVDDVGTGIATHNGTVVVVGNVQAPRGQNGGFPVSNALQPNPGGYWTDL